jgi:hypothetical protein
MAQTESAVVAVEVVPVARELLAAKQGFKLLVAEVAEPEFVVWVALLAHLRQLLEL